MSLVESIASYSDFFTRESCKGLIDLARAHTFEICASGMQKIQRMVLNFTLQDPCLFVWDALFCNLTSPRTQEKN